METSVNNKCKAFTSLEQSNKLAKFLPLESADMFYLAGGGEPVFIGNKIVTYGEDDYDCLGGPDILCWSLAALLEEIPEIINFDDDESDYALEILKKGDLYYLSYGNPLVGDKLNIEPQENFIDACVAMVEKLNELNLL